MFFVNFNTKRLIGAGLLILGIVLVLLFLPSWIWCMLVGAVLVLVGILIIKAC